MRLNPRSKLLVALVVVVATLVCGYAFLLQDPYKSAVYAPGRSLKDYRADLRRSPAAVLEFAGVQPGMKVVDLLGGAGYYAEMISRIVGDNGHVYLQNNSLFLRFSEEGLNNRLSRREFPNLTRLDSEFADLKLPDNLDMIFMGLCYHDIYVPREDPVIMTSREEFFPQIFEALKPGGYILVIDHAAAPGTGKESAAWHHRIEEEFAVRDFERAGFGLVGRLDVLRNSSDNHDLQIWDDEVIGKTDRFVLLFQKGDVPILTD